MDVNSKLKDYRNEISKFKKEFYEKATKKDLSKVSEDMEACRSVFDLQYDLVKAELKSSVGQISKFTKMVTIMQQEMKQRDDAFRKVPQNTAQILKDLMKKMEETVKHVKSVDSKFAAKADKEFL